jgi:predicted secreted protein
MRSALFLAVLLSLPLAACAADTDDGSVTGDDDEVKKASTVTIGEKDDGKTVSMSAAGTLVLKLPASSGGGYSWSVASTDRTFGYPTEGSEAMGPPGIVGGPSMSVFTWKKNPLLRAGSSHKVTLEHKRAWETNKPPADTFEFTVTLK